MVGDGPPIAGAQGAFKDGVKPYRHLQAGAFFYRVAKFVFRFHVNVGLIALHPFAGLLTGNLCP